jgi:AcrR family transcriptional regulator
LSSARTAASAADSSWQGPLAGGLRKIPLQERSRAMVEHVVDTAARLVEEGGFEAVVGSPTLLLERSGVSRGSFYAFFESPERVLDELTYRQIVQSVDGLRKAFDGRKGRRWTETVEVLVDFYAEEHRAPLIRELWVRQNLTHKARDLDQMAIEDLAGYVLAEFRRHAPRFADLSLLQCTVAVHALERLCQLAFFDDPDGDPAILAEAKNLLTGYFAAHE